MGKHDYTLSNISAISGSLINCGNLVENSILSVETMPYSWDTGLLHTVVQWFEVLQILGERDKLARLIQKADQRLAITAGKIGRKDLNASVSLDSGLTSLNALNSTASNLLTELSDYSKIQECMPCEWKDCKIAAIYGLEDYVSYDSETGVYSIHNKSSLKKLMSKEMLTETEKGMIIRIISITVDDNGNINTNIMNDLLNCSYTSRKCSDMFPAYHVIATPGPNGASIMTESITQIYYAEYTKCTNFVDAIRNLPKDKYDLVIRLVEGLPSKITTEHLDSYDHIINFGDLYFNIKCENMQNSNKYINDLNCYTVEFEAKNKENKKENTVAKGSCIVFDNIEDPSTFKDTFYYLSDLSSDKLQEAIRNYLNSLKKNPDVLTWENLGKVGIATGKYILSFVPGFGEALDLYDTESEVLSIFIESEENKEYNKNIDEAIEDLCIEYSNQIQLSYAYFCLNGYSMSNIIVQCNEYGIVTDIKLTDNTVSPDFSFENEWNDFLGYCSKNNDNLYEEYKLIQADSFNDLPENVRNDMAYYYYRQKVSR